MLEAQRRVNTRREERWRGLLWKSDVERDDKIHPKHEAGLRAVLKEACCEVNELNSEASAVR